MSQSGSTQEPLYPPDEQRQAMRRLLVSHLQCAPAEHTASQLVDDVRRNGGSGFTKRALTLELSRMLGSKVRMNANRTLSLRG